MKKILLHICLLIFGITAVSAQGLKEFDRQNRKENRLMTPILNQIQEITSDDGEAEDFFGWSVAIDGDTAVVGAYQDDDDGSRSGAVYVFVRNGITWTQQVKLTASDAAAEQWFGYDVAISGDTIVVGGRGTYIFTRSGTIWTEQTKLPDVGSSEFSVAIDGDTVVVGESRVNSSTGAAYVYTRSGTTWTQQTVLTASDGQLGDQFGINVAIDSDTIAAGAYLDDDNANNTGSIYVFTRSGLVWTEQTKLTASDGTADDNLGRRGVSISGDTVIGDASNANPEAVYVFTRNGTVWSEQAKLTQSDTTARIAFGVSVSIDSDTAVIGASNDFENGNNSGSAYIFTRSGTIWTEHRKLLPSNGLASDFFGRSVAVNGTTIIAGAYLKDVPVSSFTNFSKEKTSNLAGANQGAAYFFNLLAPTSASANIYGRVLSPNGFGIPRAVVYLTDQNGNIKTTRTNQFGYFRFDNIEVGQTLIFNVYHKKYQFNPQVVNFDDDLSGLEFIPQ